MDAFEKVTITRKRKRREIIAVRNKALLQFQSLQSRDGLMFSFDPFMLWHNGQKSDIAFVHLGKDLFCSTRRFELERKCPQLVCVPKSKLWSPQHGQRGGSIALIQPKLCMRCHIVAHDHRHSSQVVADPPRGLKVDELGRGKVGRNHNVAQMNVAVNESAFVAFLHTGEVRQRASHNRRFHHLCQHATAFAADVEPRQRRCAAFEPQRASQWHRRVVQERYHIGTVAQLHQELALALNSVIELPLMVVVTESVGGHFKHRLRRRATTTTTARRPLAASATCLPACRNSSASAHASHWIWTQIQSAAAAARSRSEMRSPATVPIGAKHRRRCSHRWFPTAAQHDATCSCSQTSTTCAQKSISRRQWWQSGRLACSHSRNHRPSVWNRVRPRQARARYARCLAHASPRLPTVCVRAQRRRSAEPFSLSHARIRGLARKRPHLRSRRHMCGRHPPSPRIDRRRRAFAACANTAIDGGRTLHCKRLRAP